MILVNRIGDKNTSLSNNPSLFIMKVILLVTKFIFVRVKTKIYDNNLQGNHSPHE